MKIEEQPRHFDEIQIGTPLHAAFNQAHRTEGSARIFREVKINHKSGGPILRFERAVVPNIAEANNETERLNNFLVGKVTDFLDSTQLLDERIIEAINDQTRELSSEERKEVWSKFEEYMEQEGLPVIIKVETSGVTMTPAGWDLSSINK